MIPKLIKGDRLYDNRGSLRFSNNLNKKWLLIKFSFLRVFTVSFNVCPCLIYTNLLDEIVIFEYTE